MHLARSVVDLGLYAEVHNQRLRRTFGHLVKLILIATLAVTIAVALGVRGVVKRLLPEVDKIPTITIKNGEASANVPQPWTRVITDDDGKQFVLIIDTTGATEDFQPGQAGFLLKRHDLLIKGDDHKSHTLSLSRVGDRVIGPTLIKQWLARAQWLLPLAFSVLAFVWYWLAKGIQALLLTLVALIAASNRRRPLGFSSLFNVSVYALGPAVIVDAALLFLPVPHGWLLYTIIAVTYTVIGIRKIPDEPLLTLVV